MMSFKVITTSAVHNRLHLVLQYASVEPHIFTMQDK